MKPLVSARGIPYQPDAGEAVASPPPRHWPFIIRALLFFTAFAGLQLIWENVRDTGAERALIEVVLVQPAVYLINVISPQVAAMANGRFIDAAGGGLKIVSACTGTEIYFMLTAALLVFPLPWRARLAGIAIGLVFVLGMNLLRILALFYAYRSDLMMFDYLHGILLPVVLILLTSLYFLWWTARHAAHIVTVQTDRI